MAVFGGVVGNVGPSRVETLDELLLITADGEALGGRRWSIK